MYNGFVALFCDLNGATNAGYGPKEQSYSTHVDIVKAILALISQSRTDQKQHTSYASRAQRFIGKPILTFGAKEQAVASILYETPAPSVS